MSDYWVDERTTNVLEPLCHWGGYVDHRGVLLEGLSAELDRGESVQVDERDGDCFNDHLGSETPLVATLAHDHGQEGRVGVAGNMGVLDGVRVENGGGKQYELLVR